MQNNLNLNSSLSESSMSDQKTNEDFNQKQPDPSNPNEETFDSHTEILYTGEQDFGVKENEDCEEGFCWLPTDPTNYMQARKLNEPPPSWLTL